MKRKLITIAGLLWTLFRFAPTAFAFDAITEDSSAGCFFKSPNAGSFGPGPVALSLGCLGQIVVNIIELLLTLVGAVTLLFLIFGAIKFVVSRGDPKAIEGAQKMMTYAIIGAVLVLVSFMIINVVSTAFGYPNLLHQFNVFLSGEKVATFVPGP